MPSIWFGFLTAWNPQLLRYHFSDLEEFLLTGMSFSYTFYFISDTIICLNQHCWGDRALCLPWHQIESARSQQRGSFTFPISLTFLFLANLYSRQLHLLKPLHPLHSPLSPSSFAIFLLNISSSPISHFFLVTFLPFPPSLHPSTSWLPNQMISLIWTFGFLFRYPDDLRNIVQQCANTSGDNLFKRRCRAITIN